MKAAIQKASRETARLMSAHLRAEARNAGWPSHAANALSVHFDGQNFNVMAHKHHDLVGDLEYGTPSTSPTAAIRRFKNRTKDAEQFFMDRLAVHGEAHDLPTF